MSPSIGVTYESSSSSVYGDARGWLSCAAKDGMSSKRLMMGGESVKVLSWAGSADAPTPEDSPVPLRASVRLEDERFLRILGGELGSCKSSGTVSGDIIDELDGCNCFLGGGGVRGIVAAGVSARRGGCAGDRHGASEGSTGELNDDIAEGRDWSAWSGDSTPRSSASSMCKGSIIRLPSMTFGVGGLAASSDLSKTESGKEGDCKSGCKEVGDIDENDVSGDSFRDKLIASCRIAFLQVSSSELIDHIPGLGGKKSAIVAAPTES